MEKAIENLAEANLILLQENKELKEAIKHIRWANSDLKRELEQLRKEIDKKDGNK